MFQATRSSQIFCLFTKKQKWRCQTQNLYIVEAVEAMHASEVSDMELVGEVQAWERYLELGQVDHVDAGDEKGDWDEEDADELSQVFFDSSLT